ncbi:oxidoreductase [Amnibacterium sp. CER49]|uniref:oxidoreductase n=1 Tax=Amnibacterium sp. CER49 TaxID=3039161 RepID=UPI002447848E|nr:oxidoreductase [Amnibacterium sp. CER49]MDH2442805.1 oxidoreductase [Amnibacterium sp. CER49]
MTSSALLGDRPVSRIGLGAMQLAGPRVMGPPRDPDAARAVLRRAIELGVDHLDTAQYYGPDVVNELIADTLFPYPGWLRLVTKVGARRDDRGGWPPAQRPEELRTAVEDNLRSLRLERMDLVNLRLPDEGELVPLADQIGELEALRREGKLELIGISNASAEQVRLAMALTTISEVQNPYSILDRADEAVLELARSEGVPYVPFFPLGSAFTGGPRRLAKDPAITEVADRHGATPTQVALAWLLARYDRMLLIPGTGSVAHLEENLGAADVALDATDLERLEGVQQLGNPLG